MKKSLAILCVALMSAAAFSEMDNYVFTPGAINPGQTVTNSLVVRGVIRALRFNVGNATTQTNTFTLVNQGRTLFTLTKSTGTNWYFPVNQLHGQTGTALTYVGSTDSTGTNILYGPICLAGQVDCKFLNDAVITTNSPTAEIIFEK